MNKESMRELLSFLASKLSGADYDRCMNLMKDMRGGTEDDIDQNDPMPAMDFRPKYAMDSRMPGRVVADRDVAIAECESTVPRHLLIACDSAESVFRTALRHLGNPQPNLHPSALPVMFRETRRAQNGGGRIQGYDGRGESAFNQRWPDAARIKIAG